MSVSGGSYQSVGNPIQHLFSWLAQFYYSFRKITCKLSTWHVLKSPWGGETSLAFKWIWHMLVLKIPSKRGHFIKTFHWNKLIGTWTVFKMTQFHLLLGMNILNYRRNEDDYNTDNYNYGAHTLLCWEKWPATSWTLYSKFLYIWGWKAAYHSELSSAVNLFTSCMYKDCYWKQNRI